MENSVLSQIKGMLEWLYSYLTEKILGYKNFAGLRSIIMMKWLIFQEDKVILNTMHLLAVSKIYKTKINGTIRRNRQIHNRSQRFQ